MSDKYNFLNFTVFDFETTGLDYMTDQIIEAAVIRVRDGAPTMMFNTLVQLREGKHLSPKITELTGHTELDLEGGITEQQLAEILDAMIPANELIVAYNAGFDMSFLNKLFYGEGNKFPNPFLDPLTIARDRSPYPHKLGDMCKKMGIPLDDAHSAQADTLALMDLVFAMHKEKDISEYVNVLGYRRKYGEPAWIPEHATLKPQGAEVIEHSSKPKKNVLKPKTTGVVTKNKKTKTVPDDPKAFSAMLPATIRVPKDIKERIDTFMSSGDIKLTIGGFMIEDEEQLQEFEATMEYLTKVYKLDDNDVSSELDNPGEAVIHIHILPF